jgi:cytochrome c-type biogenesis protein
VTGPVGGTAAVLWTGPSTQLLEGLPVGLLSGVRETVLDGSLLLALPIAVAAGAVSFLSPCVLPLVPGYLGYVTGLTGVDLEEQRRGRMAAGIGLFVLGFTVLYVILGFTAGALGSALQRHQDVITRVLGVVTIALGLVYAGAVPTLQREARLDVRPAAGLAGAPLLGAAFGVSWTACTGPTLTAILALAGSVGAGPVRGALLATAYCLGLGIPFLLAGLAYRRAMGAFAVLRRHSTMITRVGGVMLVVVGVLLVTGTWGQLVNQLRGTISGFETVI